MDSEVINILLALFLLAVVSNSYVTTNPATLPPSPSSSSEPSSSASSSSPSSSRSPLCSCVPARPVPIRCPPCPALSPPQTTLPSPATPTLAFLSLRGRDGPCSGVVYLYLGPAHSKPVCEGSYLGGLQPCQEARCGARLSPGPSGGAKEPGFHILDSGAISNKTCKVLQIQCQGSALDSVSRELAAYKVVTGLLCVMVLVIVLVRFGPHIYTTACKRLFGRRKREWIGPTESVSFRVQSTLYPNSNADKRLSYPGLERLTVNNSREPSSNRNSDYDSY
ncbi:uncharacterized protein LOC118227596 [Anguilla anguilla]|uniref:uncharacterized protein LOC118227596 n=1 Tax=Anguilla anguilla TaxID=7936 RepID=UPI0015ADB33D|nr:uncharacterized protein LOC118227596 [Anguilla anguilla]